MGFAAVLISTWELLFAYVAHPKVAAKRYLTELVMMGSNLLFSLTDGGTAGIFWGYTIVVIASIFIYLSVGEMASMYECAPRSDREHALTFLIP